jgi:hypothetical protein
MKKRIHPYLEPKLITHTNGSTYLTGIPLLWLRFAGTPLRVPSYLTSRVSQNASLDACAGEEALLCFQTWPGTPANKGTHPAKPNFFFKAKELLQSIKSTSYPTKYLDLPPSVRFTVHVPTAELQIAQPIHKKICLVLDTDIISNPL